MRYVLENKPNWSTLLLYDGDALDLTLNPALDDGETLIFHTATGRLRYRAGFDDAPLADLPPGSYSLTFQFLEYHPEPTRLPDMLRLTLGSGLGFLGGTVAILAALTLAYRLLLADFQGIVQLILTLAAGLAALGVSLVLHPRPKSLPRSELVLTLEPAASPPAPTLAPPTRM